MFPLSFFQGIGVSARARASESERERASERASKRGKREHFSPEHQLLQTAALTSSGPGTSTASMGKMEALPAYSSVDFVLIIFGGGGRESGERVSFFLFFFCRGGLCSRRRRPRRHAFDKKKTRTGSSRPHFLPRVARRLDQHAPARGVEHGLERRAGQLRVDDLAGADVGVGVFRRT